MKRVLHFGLSENRGGIETYLYKITSNIDKSKFHFDFIDTNIGKACFHDELIEQGCNLIKITPRAKSIKQNRRELKSLFKEGKYDVFHCHLNTLSYILPIKYALKYGCKVVVHSRNAGASNSKMTNLFHRFNSIYFSLFLKRKVKAVAVSEKAGKWLFGEKSKFQVLNNGLDVNRYRFNPSIRHEKRTELGLSDEFVIGHVGAMNYAKNHEYLIEIFQAYCKYDANAKLLLIGDGNLKSDITKQINDLGLSDRVLIVGLRNDVDKLYSAMDYLVFPSRFEGFPNVILEAQTSGLKCLISDIITQEVMLTERCSTLTIEENPSVWANKIYNMKQNKTDRSYAFEFIHEHKLSIKDEMKRLQDIYDSM